MFSILFVCFANLCRSPIGEAIFRNAIKLRNLENQFDVIDSCALSSYFVGDKPDERGLTVLRRHGLDSDHISRQITNEDFDKFDYIFGMDEYIVASLKEKKRRLNKVTKAKIELLGNYHPDGRQRIADPYFDDENDLTGYENCYDISLKSINSFLDQLSLTNRNKWL